MESAKAHSDAYILLMFAPQDEAVGKYTGVDEKFVSGSGFSVKGKLAWRLHQVR